MQEHRKIPMLLLSSVLKMVMPDLFYCEGAGNS